MGHFVSQTTLGVKRPMSLVVEERSSSDQISNFEVDLSEDVTGLVPLQIFKGIKNNFKNEYKDFYLF